MFCICWFQETTVIEAHDFGALLFFVSGIIYTILQSIISSRAYPLGSTIGVCRARWVLAIIAALTFFPSILSQNQYIKSDCSGFLHSFHILKQSQPLNWRYFQGYCQLVHQIIFLNGYFSCHLCRLCTSYCTAQTQWWWGRIITILTHLEAIWSACKHRCNETFTYNLIIRLFL